MYYVWHSRSRQMSNRYLFSLDELKLLSSIDKIDLEFCEYCIMDKHHRQVFDVENHYVHTQETHSFKFFL